MALAIIGGQPERFAPFAELHRQAAREAGHDPAPALSMFLAQISVGALPPAKTLRAIELLGAEVAPAVRAEIGCRNAASDPARAGQT